MNRCLNRAGNQRESADKIQNSSIIFVVINKKHKVQKDAPNPLYLANQFNGTTCIRKADFQPNMGSDAPLKGVRKGYRLECRLQKNVSSGMTGLLQKQKHKN